MKTVVHKAESKAHANHSELDLHHRFSFAGYFNPERMDLGVLQVLNYDDVVSEMGSSSHSQ